jgi:hypothetical protein
MAVKLSLRKKDYGLPLGKTIDKIAQYPYYYGRFNKNSPKEYEYKATFQRIDTDKLRLRRGDMIRFSPADYRGGFGKKVRGEFGVILERYRIIKRKLNGTYKDYYAVVLITSGELKGQLQHVGCHKLSCLSKNI